MSSAAGTRAAPPSCTPRSRALAVLETFVHVTLEARTMRFLLYTIRLPRRPRLERYVPLRRPRSLTASQETGRAWIDSAVALALVVPSVIVAHEANYVLNVRHPQFAQLELGKPEAFSFDERLWRR